MCDLAVDLAAIASAHGYGREAFADSLVHLEPHLQDKVALLDRSRLTIAPEWRAATRLVCAAFDSRLDAGLRKHALAV